MDQLVEETQRRFKEEVQRMSLRKQARIYYAGHCTQMNFVHR
jgi:hypothetical protein